MSIQPDPKGIKEGAVDYRNFVNLINPTIVEIGAHDGYHAEGHGFQELLSEIRTVGDFRLILVEPLTPFFEYLQVAYGNEHGERVSYCKHAIAETDGTVKMIWNRMGSRVSTEGKVEVQSKTWNTFVNDMHITDIELLLIDAEGYDFKIIKQIDFTKIKPRIIRFEYKELSEQDQIDCDEYLKSKGYRVEYCVHDHTYNKVAILNSI